MNSGASRELPRGAPAPLRDLSLSKKNILDRPLLLLLPGDSPREARLLDAEARHGLEVLLGEVRVAQEERVLLTRAGGAEQGVVGAGQRRPLRCMATAGPPPRTPPPGTWQLLVGQVSMVMGRPPPLRLWRRTARRASGEKPAATQWPMRCTRSVSTAATTFFTDCASLPSPAWSVRPSPASRATSKASTKSSGGWACSLPARSKPTTRSLLGLPSSLCLAARLATFFASDAPRSLSAVRIWRNCAGRRRGRSGSGCCSRSCCHCLLLLLVEVTEPRPHGGHGLGVGHAALEVQRWA